MTIQVMTQRVAEPQTQGLLDRLARQPADSLLALIGECRRDPRANKIDVGVGVYRDATGATPVFEAVKLAERSLLETQISKGYLGPEGDTGFLSLLTSLVFGDADLADRLSGLQTPGGTGALRLAAELIAKAKPDARVFVGGPTWPNHHSILAASGLAVVNYSYFDVATQTLDLAAMLAALGEARRGDVALLHGCCHNPTGADLDPAQWAEVADLLAARGVIPLIDLAYHGLGNGLADDAAGMRIVLDRVDEALVAYSCDKNFGLYRERTGALFALSRNADASGVTQSNLLALARANWSMPPDHGAAVVRIILEDQTLINSWREELEAMRRRIVGIRGLLAAADQTLAPLTAQHGMFATLPLTAGQVATLRRDHAIYMPASGRINLAGLTDATIPAFVAALSAVRTF